MSMSITSRKEGGGNGFNDPDEAYKLIYASLRSRQLHNVTISDVEELCRVHLQLNPSLAISTRLYNRLQNAEDSRDLNIQKFIKLCKDVLRNCPKSGEASRTRAAFTSSYSPPAHPAVVSYTTNRETAAVTGSGYNSYNQFSRKKSDEKKVPEVVEAATRSPMVETPAPLRDPVPVEEALENLGSVVSEVAEEMEEVIDLVDEDVRCLESIFNNFASVIHDVTMEPLMTYPDYLVFLTNLGFRSGARPLTEAQAHEVVQCFKRATPMERDGVARGMGFSMFAQSLVDLSVLRNSSIADLVEQVKGLSQGGNAGNIESQHDNMLTQTASQASVGDLVVNTAEEYERIEKLQKILENPKLDAETKERVHRKLERSYTRVERKKSVRL